MESALGTMDYVRCNVITNSRPPASVFVTHTLILDIDFCLFFTNGSPLLVRHFLRLQPLA